MRVLMILVVAVVALSCGPDLNPTRYDIGSVQWNNLEEYTFNYKDGRLQSVTGSDTTTLEYTYYKDSVRIALAGKTGRVTQYTTQVFNGSSLTKVRIRWRYLNRWYRDSVSFSYAGGNLSNVNFRGINYPATVQNGNVTNLRRNLVSLGNLTVTYDGVTNPFQKIYWKDEFFLLNGATASLQPVPIARYFSKNNIATTEGTILGVTSKQRFQYDYLYDILPKSANVEEETSKGVTSNLIFIGLIVYVPKQTNTTP